MILSNATFSGTLTNTEAVWYRICLDSVLDAVGICVQIGLRDGVWDGVAK
jgi:hypothetical protein